VVKKKKKIPLKSSKFIGEFPQENEKSLQTSQFHRGGREHRALKKNATHKAGKGGEQVAKISLSCHLKGKEVSGREGETLRGPKEKRQRRAVYNHKARELVRGEKKRSTAVSR